MPSGHSMLCISALVHIAVEQAIHSGIGKAWLFGVVPAFVLLAPVPWSRVELHDHTSGQVAVGGALGIVYGMSRLVSFFLRSSSQESHGLCLSVLSL